MVRLFSVTMVVAFCVAWCGVAAAQELLSVEELGEIAVARELPPQITGAQRAQLKPIVAALKAGKSTYKKQWATFLKQNKPALQNVDINQLIQAILREAYMEHNEDLAFHAEKVKYFNAQKKAVRDHLKNLRGKAQALKAKASIKGKQKPVAIKKPVLPNKFEPGSEPVADETETVWVTPEDLDAEIEKWEEQLNTIGDDAQLANIDMQNMLQKQQQTLQTMSNVCKTLHDTATAVIRKIG